MAETASHDQRGAAALDERLAQRGLRIERAVLISRTPAELYAYWRELSNLPRFMSNLERIEVIDERRSRWTARAPRLAGGHLSWEAEIVRDEPGRAIAWRSLPGSDIETAGEISFARALGERGCEVRVALLYAPPAGRLGHAFAAVFGGVPRRQVREDLRRFKRLMETGEIPTIDGQPRGTCRGHGRRERP